MIEFCLGRYRESQLHRRDDAIDASPFLIGFYQREGADGHEFAHGDRHRPALDDGNSWQMTMFLTLPVLYVLSTTLYQTIMALPMLLPPDKSRHYPLLEMGGSIFPTSLRSFAQHVLPSETNCESESKGDVLQ